MFDQGGTAAEYLGERPALLSGEYIPSRHLDCGLRHLMSTNRSERVEDLPRMREGAAKHDRRDEIGDDVPGRARRFSAVKRIRIGHAFADAGHPVVFHRDEHEAAIMDPAEARLEKGPERKAQEPELDPLDSHRTMLSQSPGPFAILRLGYLDSIHRHRRPAGVGKSLLADRLGSRLDATVVLDETENPFLADFYGERPGAGFQAQLFFTLSRHRQQTALRQSDLFSQLTICDYLFDRDKIYAYLNLDDNELFIYQRLYELLAQDVPSPDLVIFLQTPTDVLKRRIRERERANSELLPLHDEYVRELNEAYNHFFFHYNATPLLVVETSQFDCHGGKKRSPTSKPDQDDGQGHPYYVPRT